LEVILGFSCWLEQLVFRLTNHKKGAKKMFKRKHALLFVVLMITILSFGAIGQAQELVQVRFGMTPFVDYGPWILAQELGFFREEGLDVTFINLASDTEIAEAMAGGALDVGVQSPDSALYYYPQNPSLRIVHIGTLFEGFAITGRNEFTTYDEFLKQGVEPLEAARRTALQLEGKVILTSRGSVHESIVYAALEVAGLSEHDVKIVDIPTPVEGVAAFLQGEGDFFTAGLPQTMRLLQEGYPRTIPGAALGTGGINLSGLQSSEQYFQNNKDTIVKIVRAWYKAVSYLHQNDTEALPIIVNWLNRNTGAGLTVESARRSVTEDLKFAGSPIQSYQWFYTEGSRSEWKAKLTHRLELLERVGNIPEGRVDLDEMVVSAEIEELVLQSFAEEIRFK
jgi:ABC-type nitrate/sulfonate/bicarbonate transport system substrate-binding protein